MTISEIEPNDKAAGTPHPVEYVFMVIVLFGAAFGLALTLILLLYGIDEFAKFAVPLAILLVCAPAFVWIFLRLKTTELRSQNRDNLPKRRSSQFIQVVSFVACLGMLIILLALLLIAIGGGAVGSIYKLLLDAVIVLGIYGSILNYFWKNERRS